MKFFTFICFYLCYINLFAQQSNILVEYEYENLFYKNSETLIANNKNAKIITGELKKTNNKGYVKNDDGNYEVFQKHIFIRKKEIFATAISNNLNIKMPYKKKKILLVKDSIVSLNWKLSSDETKKIGKFNCSKAMLNFRGRNYVVWYTNEIPVPFGPWKFKNLPGLILQAYNTEKNDKFIWTAKNIIFPFKNTDEIIFKKTNDKKIVTLQEFITLKDKERLNKNKISTARLPKNTKQTSYKSIRKGLELIYEWEE